MHEFVDRWRITWMETWAMNMVDLVQPGYFEFTDDDMGEFAFCALKGWMDVRVSHRTPLLEFSWQGVSEGDELYGRGKIEFPTPDYGEGIFLIHCGDESRFTIERES